LTTVRVPVQVRIGPLLLANTGPPHHYPPLPCMGTAAMARLRRGWGGRRLFLPAQGRPRGRRRSALCAEKPRQVATEFDCQVTRVVVLG